MHRSDTNSTPKITSRRKGPEEASSLLIATTSAKQESSDKKRKSTLLISTIYILCIFLADFVLLIYTQGIILSLIAALIYALTVSILIFFAKRSSFFDKAFLPVGGISAALPPLHLFHYCAGWLGILLGIGSLISLIVWEMGRSK